MNFLITQNQRVFVSVAVSPAVQPLHTLFFMQQHLNHNTQETHKQQLYEQILPGLKKNKKYWQDFSFFF